MKKTCLVILISLLSICGISGQKVAIKNNLAYDALRTPNLSLEVALSRKVTFDVQAGANFFFYTTDPTSSSYKNKKWSHWLVQPEIRYWTCESFNGFFVGAHALGGMMNVSGVNIPFIKKHGVRMQDHRYEGHYWGGGLSVGYHWILSNRFSMEASVGWGAARITYDKYYCTTCSEKIGEGHANYFGPTKAALSLIVMLK